MKQGFIKLAIDEAIKSDHKHKTGAVIFSGKRIISIGHNYSSRHVNKLHPKYIKYPGSVHAEVNAIIKAKKNLTGFDILIVRVNRKMELMLAFPCKYCLSYLIDVGIRNVYFSTNNHNIEKIKL